MNLRTALPLACGVSVLGLLGYGASMVFTSGDTVEAAAVVPLAAAPADPAPAAAVQALSRSTVDEAWVSATATKAGISNTALRAYASAQLAAPAGCGVGWTTLAGIGWVESHHGTIDGRTLGADGVPSAPITGIPLGDLDRAYGPMQFIPSTWKTWGIDADGDGAEDPQNINDAALAAANYLCASGSLTTGQAWSAAVFSYNHSQEYVQQVYAAAQEYAARTS